MLSDPGRVTATVIVVWLLTEAATYVGIRVYLTRQGVPDTWRLNEHAARAFPGHLSFYEKDGYALRLRPYQICPVFWRVERTPEQGMLSDLEVARRGPVWRVVPWAYRWMDDLPDSQQQDAGGGCT